MEETAKGICKEGKKDYDSVQEKWKKKSEPNIYPLQGFITDFEELREKSKSSLNEISNLIEATKKEEQAPKDYSSKLSSLYEEAYYRTVSEMECLQKYLSVIHGKRAEKNSELFAKKEGKRHLSKDQLLKVVEQSALSLPLWVSRGGEEPPPLCGAVPAHKSYSAQVGELVAALVKVGDDKVWILSEIISYSMDTGEYVVEDIDEEQKQYAVSRAEVIPLPQMRASPEDSKDRAVSIFPENSLVLARFPQTTCFYRAVVQKTPKTFKEPYTLLFEDNTHPSGYSVPLKVHQRYVIHCAES